MGRATIFALALAFTPTCAVVEAGTRVLNNFVTELVNIAPDEDASGEIPFTNPRNGWVYVSTKSQAHGGDLVVSVPTAPSHNERTARPAADPQLHRDRALLRPINDV
jgi:hypothetical protein